MFKLDANDIAILFKKLVVLPSDQSALEPEENKSKASAPVDEKTSKTTPEPVAEPAAPLSTNPVQPNTPTAPVEEPKVPTSEKLHHLFAIWTSPELLPLLRNPQSNFSKTLQALNIGSCTKYTITLPDALDQIQYDCLWTIGLNPEQEDKVRNLQHPNLLMSPNLEELKTKEQKMAMWTPLKDFVQRNQNLLAKL